MGDMQFIINPAGNGGAGLKVWQAFQQIWPEPIDSASVSFTEYPTHARKIAAETDCKTIVVAGGDGTVGEVISGIMDQPEPRPKLAIIPCGTGNDIARCGDFQTLEESIDVLKAGTSRSFDLIRVERESETRHAFLFANTGFSSIPRMKPWMKRLLGATGAYYLATLLEVMTYKPRYMNLLIDGQDYSAPTFLVIASNAEYAGGGSMRIAPGAKTDDGRLNISIIKPLPLFKLVTKLFSSIADGSYIKEPEVTYLTGKKIEVSCNPPAVLDLDGELFGTTPAMISIVPKGIEILSHEPDV